MADYDPGQPFTYEAPFTPAGQQPPAQQAIPAPAPQQPATPIAPFVPNPASGEPNPGLDDALKRSNAALSSPQEFDHPAGATGTSTSAVPTTVSSEPTPQVNKPPIDPRPYAWVAKNNPQLKQVIDHAAELTGVDPDRIAAHMYIESKMNLNVGRGHSGEIGPMQIMPSTAAKYTANGRLDPFNPADNVLIGGLVLRDLDAQYGKNTFSSIAHYNWSGRGQIPTSTVQYVKQILPTAGGADEIAAHAAEQRPGSMSPAGLVNAGVKGGPDGFFQYAAQTAPSGTPTSDIWRMAEASLVHAFIEKGDLAGAQHARDFVFQMAHVGSNMNLMGAARALQAGDGTSAAQYLAKAHAFFPDGTIGRFRTDGRNVWAERVDENNPSLRIGPAMQVTAGDVAGLLNQTTDPQQFLKTLTEQQKAAADMRFKTLHGDYYASLPTERANAAALRAASSKYSADTRAAATVESAQIRANAQMAKPNNALNTAIDRETENLYGQTPIDPTVADMPPAQRAMLANIYRGVRSTGRTPPEAEAVAKGLSDRTLQLLRQADGNYGVVGTNDPNKRPIAYLPKDVGDQLAPPQQAVPASPVGSAATNPAMRGMMMGSGMTSNLAGTQAPVNQSSAMPTGR